MEKKLMCVAIIIIANNVNELTMIIVCNDESTYWRVTFINMIKNVLHYVLYTHFQ
jgi:hypothetical protein